MCGCPVDKLILSNCKPKRQEDNLQATADNQMYQATYPAGNWARNLKIYHCEVGDETFEGGTNSTLQLQEALSDQIHQ